MKLISQLILMLLAISVGNANAAKEFKFTMPDNIKDGNYIPVTLDFGKSPMHSPVVAGIEFDAYEIGAFMPITDYGLEMDTPEKVVLIHALDDKVKISKFRIAIKSDKCLFRAVSKSNSDENKPVVVKEYKCDPESFYLEKKGAILEGKDPSSRVDVFPRLNRIKVKNKMPRGQYIQRIIVATDKGDIEIKLTPNVTQNPSIDLEGNFKLEAVKTVELSG